jgi:hypothetical protein
MEQREYEISGVATDILNTYVSQQPDIQWSGNWHILKEVRLAGRRDGIYPSSSIGTLPSHQAVRCRNLTARRDLDSSS